MPKSKETSQPNTHDWEALVADIAERVEEIVGKLHSSKKETTMHLNSMESKLEEVLKLLSGGNRRSEAPVVNGGDDETTSKENDQVHTSNLEQNQSSGRVANQVVNSSIKNRENWLKKMEMPIFDGDNAY